MKNKKVLFWMIGGLAFILVISGIVIGLLLSNHSKNKSEYKEIPDIIKLPEGFYAENVSSDVSDISNEKIIYPLAHEKYFDDMQDLEFASGSYYSIDMSCTAGTVYDKGLVFEDGIPKMNDHILLSNNAWADYVKRYALDGDMSGWFVFEYDYYVQPYSAHQIEVLNGRGIELSETDTTFEYYLFYYVNASDTSGSDNYGLVLSKNSFSHEQAVSIALGN